MAKTCKSVEELAKDRKFVVLADTWGSKWDVYADINEELFEIFHVSYSMKLAIDKMLELLYKNRITKSSTYHCG